ncbi:MAG: hypothetical protein LUH36_00085, partial [Oscillospiraceae bacterium]|nr:hypothetical protein [Oscillospiraceae bacterium]
QIHTVGESEIIQEKTPQIRSGQPVLDRFGNPRMQANFPMYFGNMGEGKDKNGVFSRDGLRLKITCMVSDQAAREALLDFIEENLELFFLTHNFGTRQTKGYGGFIGHSDKSTDDYLEMLCQLYPRFIYFRYQKQLDKRLAEDVDLVCMAMKTRRNETVRRNIEDNYVKGFLMTYGEGGNDKAMMKGEFCVGLSRGGGRPGSLGPGPYYFKRGLLGLTDNYLFRQLNGEKRNATISVSHRKGQIVRFPSPILVKVIPGAVCFLPEDVEPMLDEEFVFRYRGQRKVISTPKHFDTTQFLVDFAAWYKEQFGSHTFSAGSLRDRCSKIKLEVIDHG